jgi:hypothetical protein
MLSGHIRDHKEISIQSVAGVGFVEVNVEVS